MKQIKKLRVNYDINWTCTSIDKIRKDLDSIESLGATKIDIDYGVDEFGYPYIYITPYHERLETDEEAEYRDGEIKRIELDQLKRLKLKYE